MAQVEQGLPTVAANNVKLSKPPQTIDEWLTLVQSRQRHFTTMSMEVDWEEFEEGELIDQWRQVIHADDFGRMRIENLGRIGYSRNRFGLAVVSDEILAFDGKENRELSKRWEYSRKLGLTMEAKEALRRQTPHGLQARIEFEPRLRTPITSVITPGRTADYQFVMYLLAAKSDGGEISIRPADDGTGNWMVTVDIASESVARRCQAIVDPERNLYAIAIDIWAKNQLSEHYEADYAQKEGYWHPSRGKKSTPENQFGEQFIPSKESRFEVTSVSFGEFLSDEQFKVSFPTGTLVADIRNDAVYKVGDENKADDEMARLVAEAKPLYAALLDHQEEAKSWPSLTIAALKWLGVGALIGVAIGWSRRRVLQVNGSGQVQV